MRQFNPYNVIIIMLLSFYYPQSSITSEEIEVNEKIERMLLNIQNKEFYVEEEEILDFYDTYEIPKSEKVNLFEEDDKDGKVYLPEEVICSSVEATISSDKYKRQAVEYWRILIKEEEDRLKELNKGSKKLPHYDNYDDGKTKLMKVVDWKN